MSGGRTLAWSVAVAGATTTLVVWFGWVQLHTPPAFDNPWGFAHEGRSFSLLAVHAAAVPWSREAVAVQFRLVLSLLWIVWALGAVVLTRARPSLRTGAVIAAPVVALVVVLVPPMLSRDLLGYVAYGRVFGLYGLDPYTNGRAALSALGDPAATYLVWETPLPYGPLWVLVAGAIAYLGQEFGLWFEVMAHKALAGLSLVVGAAAGGRLATHDRQGAVLLAMSLNPLLLVESAANGHNDAMMTAFLLSSMLLGSKGRHTAAAVALGLAVGIKPVAIVALPLVFVARWLDGLTWRSLVSATAATFVVPAALTMLVSSLPEVIGALAARVNAGPPRSALLVTPTLAAAFVVGWVQLRRPWADARPRDWLLAWVPIAIVLAVIVAPVRFPWYLTWALMPALTFRDRRGLPHVVSSVAVGFWLMWQYAVAR